MHSATRNGHTWYIIFMLISIEKSETLLHLIEFPQQVELAKIRTAAQQFVEEYSKVFFQPYAFDSDERQQNALDSMHEAVSGNFNEDEARQFYEWSNRLLMERALERSIQLMWTFVVLPLARNIVDLNFFAPTEQAYIASSLQIYKQKQTEIIDAIRSAEESSSTEWEKRAIEIYNGGLEYSPDSSMWTTPYDYILVLFKRIALPRWIKETQRTLSEDDFEKLDRYLEHQLRARKSTATNTSLHEFSSRLT